MSASWELALPASVLLYVSSNSSKKRGRTSESSSSKRAGKLVRR